MDIHARHRAPHHSSLPAIARPAGCDGIGLILQGGGALGAYQAGVYQALHEAGLEPDWVAGVSIGAINAAIIAGNEPAQRLEKLEKFWLDITASDPFTLWPEGDAPRMWRNMLSALNGILFGQPGFFRPQPVSGFLAPRGSRAATSLYDTSPLHQTLNKLVDFNLINDGPMRFAVGAVNVTSANFIYFDNRQVEICPEHVMASGALPPGLPMVRIGRHLSGMAASSQHAFAASAGQYRQPEHADLPGGSVLAHGEIPRDMPEVLARQKDIQYSSRTRTTTDHFLETHRLKRALREALNLAPEGALNEAQRELKAEPRPPARDQHHAADL